MSQKVLYAPSLRIDECAGIVHAYQVVTASADDDPLKDYLTCTVPPAVVNRELPPSAHPPRVRVHPGRIGGKGDEMGRKRQTAEQIIQKLREAEVELAKGQTTAVVACKLGSPSKR